MRLVEVKCMVEVRLVRVVHDGGEVGGMRLAEVRFVDGHLGVQTPFFPTQLMVC